MPIDEYVDRNGEVWSKEGLVQEIEKMLNAIDSKHQSILAPEIIQALDISTLGAIYENLAQKQGSEISNNQDWLFSLVD